MTRTVLLKNATVVGQDGLRSGWAVRVSQGRIAEVGPDRSLGRRAGERAVDLGGRYLAPGFIDLHIHGMGRDLVDRGPAALSRICRLLPRYGVTGFLPTICPRPAGADAAFAKRCAGVRSSGARILGFHFEGPFLTLTGALPKEALGSADPARIRALIAAVRPYRPVFSISPDFRGVIGLLRAIRRGGGAAFITHTRASVRETEAAIAAGARHATHFYDVFPAPPETEPGVRPSGAVEAILADPRVSVDFILDGAHVDPVAVRMALACKGPDRVCLITDANVGAGLGAGRYRFIGGQDVVFERPGGPARLARPDGTMGALAGSGLTLDAAVRNAVRLLGLDVAQAVRLASANPARVLGLGAQFGEVAAGAAADLVVLDRALRVEQTWIGGRCVFRRRRRLG